MSPSPFSFLFFFFNDTATTEIYTLSLHDALPISHSLGPPWLRGHFHQPSPTGPLSGGSRFRRYTEGPNPEPLPLTADRPILESRHVPQHQNAFPFRSAGDGRRGARRFPAVRPENHGLPPPVKSQRGRVQRGH